MQCLVRQDEPVLSLAGPSAAASLLSLLTSLQQFWSVIDLMALMRLF